MLGGAASSARWLRAWCGGRAKRVMTEKRKKREIKLLVEQLFFITSSAQVPGSDTCHGARHHIRGLIAPLWIALWLY
jgi:hypothetical protein